MESIRMKNFCAQSRYKFESTFLRKIQVFA